MFGLTIDYQGYRMDIGQPVTPGTVLGMGDVITELWLFTTEVALQF